MIRPLAGAALLGALLISGVTRAEKTVGLDKLTITGNQELPRVTYFLPWQVSPAPKLADPPLDQLTDEALAPVDRDAFRRQLRYYRARAASPAAEPPAEHGR